jgi:hypothetical protein
LSSLSVLLQAAAAAAAAEAENEEGDEEGRANTAAAAVKENYDYLLSMAIYSLTWEKVQVCWAVSSMSVRRERAWGSGGGCGLCWTWR